MNFKIYRGTKEIGGSCVEVWTENPIYCKFAHTE